MIKLIVIGDRERALLVRKSRLERILTPGVYRIFDPFNACEVERVSLDSQLFTGEWSRFIMATRPDLVQEHFTVVETGPNEVALIYAEGKLIASLSPDKRQLFWNVPLKITSEIFNALESPEVPANKASMLARLPAAPVTNVQVETGKIGLLFIDNRFIRTLEPGAYTFWNAVQKPVVELVDLRPQVLEVPGQEILTKDKVSLRVNVVAWFKVLDPVKMRQNTKDAAAQLYSALQRAVRVSLGARTLEEILSEKVAIAPEAQAAVRLELAVFGVEVSDMSLKDIILPGDMRVILNQVVAAEKQAQANLIRRREETAATRSLLNTANLMKDNPVLIRLKELETLERLTEKVDKISVSQGLEGLLTLISKQ